MFIFSSTQFVRIVNFFLWNEEVTSCIFFLLRRKKNLKLNQCLCLMSCFSFGNSWKSIPTIYIMRSESYWQSHNKGHQSNLEVTVEGDVQKLCPLGCPGARSCQNLMCSRQVLSWEAQQTTLQIKECVQLAQHLTSALR